MLPPNSCSAWTHCPQRLGIPCGLTPMRVMLTLVSFTLITLGSLLTSNTGGGARGFLSPAQLTQHPRLPRPPSPGVGGRTAKSPTYQLSFISKTSYSFPENKIKYRISERFCVCLSRARNRLT